jgi:dipeptidase
MNRVKGRFDAFALRREAGLFAALLSLISVPASASVAVYVGRNLTADGSVLLAGYGDEPSSHWLSIVPARDHAADATVTVGATSSADMPGELIEIPQVPRTFRYISMDYSYFLGLPAPLTNGGLNEHGVAVRDVALTSRKELVDMTPNPQRGLNYSDLARIVLERARSAREAMEIVTNLIDTHGYATYGGNSHVFADAEEGWVVLEFAGGQGLWVARRLGPDDLWMNWRGYHGFGYVQELPAGWRENPNYRASANFDSFAAERGWFSPAAGKHFNVIDVYAKRDQYTDFTAREARQVESGLRAAAPRISVEQLMKVLRATGRDSSGYGQVAHLRAEVPADLRTLWVAPGPPVTAPFVPWKIGVESVPPEFRRHRYLTAGEAERTVDPLQRGLESTRYANRAVKRLLYLVDEHRQELLPEVIALLDAHDRKLLEAQPGVERTARILLDAGEGGLARRYLTEQSHAAAADALRLLEGLADAIELRTRLLYGIRVPEATSP